MISRRSFLIGAAAALAAPAVIRTAGLLMPVRKVIDPVVLATLMRIQESLMEKMVWPPIGLPCNHVYWCDQLNGVRAAIVELSDGADPTTMNWSPPDPNTGRKVVGADWPSRTIKAPPGGFNIA